MKQKNRYRIENRQKCQKSILKRNLRETSLYAQMQCYVKKTYL